METKRALPQPTVTGTSRLAFQTEIRKKEGKKKEREKEKIFVFFRLGKVQKDKPTSKQSEGICGPNLEANSTKRKLCKNDSPKPT